MLVLHRPTFEVGLKQVAVRYAGQFREGMLFDPQLLRYAWKELSQFKSTDNSQMDFPAIDYFCTALS